MPEPRVYENASVLFLDALNKGAEFRRVNETDLIKPPTGNGKALPDHGTREVKHGGSVQL
ncbi:MAG TPA: hypothetical protein VGP62_15180 [Bryobacteraceae bacterium]|jgi:hypothetical protein|nr:hypothetical protein [Bryobacteraceae bacterium]